MIICLFDTLILSGAPHAARRPKNSAERAAFRFTPSPSSIA
jgi:hypothetical protein